MNQMGTGSLLRSSTLIRRAVRGGRALWAWHQRQARERLREVALTLFRGGYPHRLRVINLLINDICNSRCEMCLIWKRKRDHEVSPEELEHILSDSSFRFVEYVGVSGGEPTLRRDLPRVYDVLCRTLPRLLGTGIITNCVKPAQVIERVRESAAVCLRHGVRFHVMVSLDGVGDVHDRVRGRSGNYAAVLQVVRGLRDNRNVSINVGCTITKTNVWDVDNLLALCRDEGVHVRFRVAEYIERLYNSECKDVIRNFDEDESYHLALFFKKLELGYESDPEVRATYRSIQGMLYEGRPRTSGCPYQTHAVMLSSRGSLAYCAPKSPELGSCLERSAGAIYRENLRVRRGIIARDCASCVHDYHAPPTRQMIVADRRRRYWQRQMSLERAVGRSRRVRSADQCSVDLAFAKSILITGWYGTETAGDKAVLAELVAGLRDVNPGIRISVSSLYPFVTHRTLRELVLRDVHIVPGYSQELLNCARESEVVMIGGGPLMGIEPLGMLLSALLEARRAGGATIIEGCGIGPLESRRDVNAVREIVRLSNVVRLRDRESTEWVKRECDRADAECVTDPAAHYVRRWKSAYVARSRANSEFVCLLRALTDEYAAGLRDAMFEDFRTRFDQGLAEMVRYIQRRTGLVPVFVPMHTFIVGGDDRDYVRRFTRLHLAGVEHRVYDRVYSPDQVLDAIAGSALVLGMRYHSILFAEELGRDYIAVDYTGGGKISAFLRGRGRTMRCVGREEVAAGRWREVVDRGIPARLLSAS